jgi:hypothetical protein
VLRKAAMSPSTLASHSRIVRRTGRRRTAAVAATAFLGGLALLSGSSGANAQTPGTTPPPPPHVGDLMVNPSTGLVDGQEVTITASAQSGGENVAYSYYVSLCPGPATAATGGCETVAGPLWPVNGRVTTAAHLPAVLNHDPAGAPVDCRTLPSCTVVAFPYRDPDSTAVAAVSFAPASAGRPDSAKPVPARPRYTG